MADEQVSVDQTIGLARNSSPLNLAFASLLVFSLLISGLFLALQWREARQDEVTDVPVETPLPNLLEQPESAHSFREALEKPGLRIGRSYYIKDFETGYSSLSYLNRLPVSEIKIDRDFVEGICDNPTDANLVRSIIALSTDDFSGFIH